MLKIAIIALIITITLACPDGYYLQQANYVNNTLYITGMTKISIHAEDATNITIHYDYNSYALCENLNACNVIIGTSCKEGSLVSFEISQPSCLQIEIEHLEHCELYTHPQRIIWVIAGIFAIIMLLWAAAMIVTCCCLKKRKSATEFETLI